jgi:hypothetical protein
MENKLTDAQMVEKVAREVMGYTDFELNRNSPRYATWKNGESPFRQIFRPLTDANDTQMIKDKLREMGYRIRITIDQSGFTYVIIFVTICGAEETIAMSMNKSESRAICEAAIKAVEGK